eukprot:9283481-Alexandrium_andersonii.AAC.1
MPQPPFAQARTQLKLKPELKLGTLALERLGVPPCVVQLRIQFLLVLQSIMRRRGFFAAAFSAVSYTHLRAHETSAHL